MYRQMLRRARRPWRGVGAVLRRHPSGSDHGVRHAHGLADRPGQGRSGGGAQEDFRALPPATRSTWRPGTSTTRSSGPALFLMLAGMQLHPRRSRVPEDSDQTTTSSAKYMFPDRFLGVVMLPQLSLTHLTVQLPDAEQARDLSPAVRRRRQVAGWRAPRPACTSRTQTCRDRAQQAGIPADRARHQLAGPAVPRGAAQLPARLLHRAVPRRAVPVPRRRLRALPQLKVIIGHLRRRAGRFIVADHHIARSPKPAAERVTSIGDAVSRCFGLDDDGYSRTGDHSGAGVNHTVSAGDKAVRNVLGTFRGGGLPDYLAGGGVERRP